MEQDSDLASQVKSGYDMESYCAVMQVDPRSAADERAFDILENTTVHNGERFDVGMLWLNVTSHCPTKFFQRWFNLNLWKSNLRKTSF